MHGKFKLYFAIVSMFHIVIGNFGIKIKKKILINCRELFHFHHIKPVVDFLVMDDRIIVYFLENKGFEKSDIPKEYLKNCKIVNEKSARFIKFDMTISLDYCDSWIPHSGINILTPHGGGMKSNYSGNDELAKFDIVFLVGNRQESLQKPFLKEGATTKKIGFIINDQLFNDLEDDSCVVDFENVRPIALYAPSWSSNPDMIMMNEDLLHELFDQDLFNVIFKPHPNLFIPDKCGGKNWNIIFDKLQKNSFKIINKSDFPIQIYMKQSDVLISDISSVIF